MVIRHTLSQAHKHTITYKPKETQDINKFCNDKKLIILGWVAAIHIVFQNPVIPAFSNSPKKARDKKL